MSTRRSIPAHAGQPGSANPPKPRVRVHPRSRGAAQPPCPPCLPVQGPSPLTRGSRLRKRRRLRAVGSIPAHAGQPGPGRPCTDRWWVHPRSRGAAGSFGAYTDQVVGPSPLTRGSPMLARVRDLAHGSIPAHAGQPRAERMGREPVGVHPRSRGAAASATTPDTGGVGPSPLTRGSRQHRAGHFQDAGSIPAHAGQPSSATMARRASRVHPRSRGAASCVVKRSSDCAGPSPLTRGSHAPCSCRRQAPGSIPAHAGQPSRCSSPTRSSRVHPRSRGAAGGANIPALNDGGPSPLTRGSQALCPTPSAWPGSIPAHAGQPLRAAPGRHRPRVHPRSRGAARPGAGAGRGRQGPSPLTRGSLVLDPAVQQRLGSIPAHAGQPLTANLLSSNKLLRNGASRQRVIP